MGLREGPFCTSTFEPLPLSWKEWVGFLMYHVLTAEYGYFLTPLCYTMSTGLLTNSTGATQRANCSVNDTFRDWDAEAAMVAASMSPAQVKAAQAAAVDIWVSERTVSAGTIAEDVSVGVAGKGHRRFLQQEGTTTAPSPEAAVAGAAGAPVREVVASSIVDSHVMTVVLVGVTGTYNAAACKRWLTVAKANEAELGNGMCNGGPWNTAICGYDLGKCQGSAFSS